MKGKSGHYGVLGAQCVVCAAVVLLALMLRFIGGSVFEQLRDLFYTAIHDDALGVALMERWQQVTFV